LTAFQTKRAGDAIGCAIPGVVRIRRRGTGRALVTAPNGESDELDGTQD
jgi:hypothetical protein